MIHSIEEYQTVIDGEVVPVQDMTIEQLREELCSMMDLIESIDGHQNSIRSLVESWRTNNASTTTYVQSKSKPVAWFKHGPYSDGEPVECVFEDPDDEVNYSALIFRDPDLRTYEA